jgi:hypothetical protein
VAGWTANMIGSFVSFISLVGEDKSYYCLSGFINGREKEVKEEEEKRGIKFG